MRGSARAARRTEDIRGEECTACNVGAAHVVSVTARSRFFSVVTPVQQRSRALVQKVAARGRACWTARDFERSSDSEVRSRRDAEEADSSSSADASRKHIKREHC